ncbi:alpha/beta hydrolase [Sulfitobacter sp. S0837]|uniref:COG3904 family protein n=1 Tax=Sulfitobacter maritimus TaxID=2741719 RepID=UPI0015814AAA|nr:alpha/beta hydrolase [Sulfitobacter maritimus]NUH64592.1 alpha/beta hydrolase [Sulfitobacter maritimus]
MIRLVAAFALLLAIAACGTLENARDGMRMQVQGPYLLVSGTITSRTPANFERNLRVNPRVDTVVLGRIDGSIDAAATHRMGRRIRAMGLATELRSNSVVDSGGVELFLAGVERRMAPGAKLRVHSWRNGYREGSSYPRNASEHQMTRRYVTQMLGSDAFYWFTLQAAPSNEIHEMTAAEIRRYGLLTQP